MKINRGIIRYFNDIVILSTIVIGLFGGTWFLNTLEKPIIGAIFFALAITSFTYRFLGGIDNSTEVTIGAIKVTGTLAAIFGSIWIIVKLSGASAVELGEKPEVFHPGKIYFFGLDGEPVELTLPLFIDGQEDTLLFPRLPREGFASVSRDLDIEAGKVHVISRKDSTILGYIQESRESLSLRLLPQQHMLALGYYYSQLDSDGNRPDANIAVDYLFRVLQEADNRTLREKALARLFYLQNKFRSVDDFENFIQATRELRVGYSKYLELGETFLTLSNRFDAEEISNKKAALVHYLMFLRTRQSESLPRRKVVQNRIIELATVYLANDPDLGPEMAAFKKAVKKHDRSRIAQFIDKLSASEDLAGKL